MELIKSNININKNGNILSNFDVYILSVYIPILFYREPNKNIILDELFYILTLYIHFKGYISFVKILTNIFSYNKSQEFDEEFIKINYLINTKNIKELNSLNITPETLFKYEYNYYRNLTNNKLFTQQDSLDIINVYNTINKNCRTGKFNCKSLGLKYHPDKNGKDFLIYNDLYNMFQTLYYQ